MFEGLFQGPLHLLVIVGIALLVLGPKKPMPHPLGKAAGSGVTDPGLSTEVPCREQLANRQQLHGTFHEKYKREG